MFEAIKKLMQQQFAALCANGPLFMVKVDRDKIWEVYLGAFTDPVQKQGNTCNCCKSFLRQYGGIVGIRDNKLVTLWDFECTDPEYRDAIAALRRYVASCEIDAPLMNPFPKCGTNQNKDGKRPIVWNHYYVELPKEYVQREDRIPTLQGEARTRAQLLMRAVNEITPQAVDAVLELMGQGSLYRGDEFRPIVEEFRKVQKAIREIPAGDLRTNHCWLKSRELSPAVCGVRNTAIGTLLVDLSEDRELDAAVSAYEKVVAPANYKRPTALVTPRMLEEARKRMDELGLMPALERRLLTVRDLNAENALHVFRAKEKGGDIFKQLKDETIVHPKSLSKVEEVPIDKFIANVLPTAKSVRVLVENGHAGNFVSLVGPKDPNTPTLFKWNNNVSWSYAGQVADAIKERVKAAGGNVEGILRISLRWDNTDDLDLHVVEPGGYHNSYLVKRRLSPSGGMLDVDANGGDGIRQDPVENIAWQTDPKVEGDYRVYVNQYSHREAANTGFEVELEYDGERHNHVVAQNGPTGRNHEVFTFNFTRKDGVKIKNSTGKAVAYASREKWGIKTGMFHRVQAVTLSPNYWGTNVGNKHVFFLLEGCKTDERVRPFLNEFLKPELEKDRKVFELLGSKVEVEAAPDELSGLGFSTTVRNHVFVEVEGATKRQIKVVF